MRMLLLYNNTCANAHTVQCTHDTGHKHICICDYEQEKRGGSPASSFKEQLNEKCFLNELNDLPAGILLRISLLRILSRLQTWSYALVMHKLVARCACDWHKIYLKGILKAL